MSSRDTILQKVKKNQPEATHLPAVYQPLELGSDAVVKFKSTLENIGAGVREVKEGELLSGVIEEMFPGVKRILSADELLMQHLLPDRNIGPATLHDLDLAVVKAKFGVAENGAVWVTEDDLKIRALPFICEHLVAIVKKDTVIGTMHEAYRVVGQEDYGFGVFIAGPSKTADIEQSLVLGAHGPKSMTVLLLD
jgi:L-lactate dehydrogenase complex protein LldG